MHLSLAPNLGTEDDDFFLIRFLLFVSLCMYLLHFNKMLVLYFELHSFFTIQRCAKLIRSLRLVLTPISEYRNYAYPSLLLKSRHKQYLQRHLFQSTQLHQVSSKLCTQVYRQHNSVNNPDVPFVTSL